jgi:hypothetical protein
VYNLKCYRDGVSHQTVHISLEKNEFDMSALLVRKSVVVESEAAFLPAAVFTTDVVARDVHFIQTCAAAAAAAGAGIATERTQGIKFVHKVLMLQQ